MMTGKEVTEFFATLGMKPAEPSELAERWPELANWLARKPKTIRYLTPEERTMLDKEISESVTALRKYLEASRVPRVERKT